jgi:hypothetical protein
MVLVDSSSREAYDGRCPAVMSIGPEMVGKMFLSNSGIVSMSRDASQPNLGTKAAREMVFARGTRR